MLHRTRAWAHFALTTVLLMSFLSLIVPLAAQEQVQIKLTPYENNPIFMKDSTLDWEAGGIGRQRVVFHDGMLYMFYLGYRGGQIAGAVGYATSDDGLHWTKSKDNPVFVPDKEIASNGVMNLAVALIGDTWTLYFTPWRAGNLWYEFNGDILIATAPEPNGPWTVAEEPALTTSTVRAWDAGGRYLQTVTASKNGFVMFYDAGATVNDIGMATSADGLHWTKYDDPATKSGPFAKSDPVFGPSSGRNAWDSAYADGPVVWQTDHGWEMFYGAGQNDGERSIGCATSTDGIIWKRVGDTPLLTDPDKLLAPEAVVSFNGTQYLYYVVLSKRFDPEGIAVATITHD
ncbi:MAG: hypothetical protein R3E39_25005 [Anaerolineae bacterium]